MTPILAAGKTYGAAFSRARFEFAHTQYQKIKEHGGPYTLLDVENNDTASLHSRFDIETLDDPEGFKALDKHTFVLTYSPDVLVRQIVVGMTALDGPAGMVCNAIEDDGLNLDRTTYSDLA
ncbi:hypothetical protein K458DRAFT_384070 [Lentithecium fluviatile CBS 122367]|uniref:Uncharacterized protein n=1 Tax=Lentithecium fluviatile CBS 122367 TaxID=1168545 RepID=A0A6G1JFU4_9PLEO|nr:hypothetical protein K458DRAFT_384070 [Lentithecium fluviatile CBS 122367]